MTASTPTTETVQVPFAQFAEYMADLAERTLRTRRREAEGNKRFCYLANYGMRELVMAEFRAEFWTNAATAAANDEAAGVATLTRELGEALAPRGKETDAFARAAEEALRDAAQRVLREALPYVDAAALLARLV